MKMTDKQRKEAIQREEKRQERLGLRKQENKIKLLHSDYHVGKFCTPCWK
ncbi:MAG: hypothetical protein KJ630_19000 [Proteobacteria bacterium]|nr:hypothetical protein [Pseudomonadota bacterium]